MDLAHRLRRLRSEHGLTQAQLAQPRYTAAYVSTIEAGRRTPSKAALEHFALRLGVEVDEILTGRSRALRAELLRAYAEARQLLASAIPSAVKDAEAGFERIAQKARRHGYPELEAKAHVGIAMCAEAANDLDRAEAVYEEALTLLARESAVARVDAVVGRARVLQTKGEIPFAAFVLEQAIAELRDTGIEDPSALLRLHSSLVAAYFDAGLIDQAAASADVSLSLAVFVDDAERLANMNLNVGLMLAEQGHWTDAESRFEEAARWFDEIHYETDLARVRLVRGLNLRKQGRYDEARPHLEAARHTFATSGQALREARATVALGRLERLAGNHDEALFLLKRAAVLGGDDAGVAGIAERELALCHVERDRAKTIKGLRRAIRLLEEAGIADELAAAYRDLGDTLSQEEELRDACDAYRKAADLFGRVA